MIQLVKRTFSKISNFFHFKRTLHILVTSAVIFVNCFSFEIWQISKEIKLTAREYRGQLQASKAVQESLQGIPQVIQHLDESSVKMGKIADGAVEDTAAIKTAVNSANTQIGIIGASVSKQLASTTAFSDEGTKQLKQEGDLFAKALNSFNTLIQNTDTRIEQVTTEGIGVIQTANTGLQGVLDEAKVVEISLDGEIKAIDPSIINANKITASLAKATDELEKKLNLTLNPPKVKGFWPNVFRIVKTYILTPMIDAARIYFLVTAK